LGVGFGETIAEISLEGDVLEQVLHRFVEFFVCSIRNHIFHFSSAKQAKTKEARADKCVPMILSGRGFNELSD
jgi:uncharacterized protein YdeI (YjbR/CyaY-like superfamily)